MEYQKKSDGMIVPYDYSEYVRILNLRAIDEAKRIQDEKINKLEEALKTLMLKLEEKNG